MHFGFLTLFVLGIYSLDFLLYEFEIVFEFLYLTIHFFYETVALLAGSIKEAKVVLVSGNL